MSTILFEQEETLFQKLVRILQCYSDKDFGNPETTLFNYIAVHTRIAFNFLLLLALLLCGFLGLYTSGGREFKIEEDYGLFFGVIVFGVSLVFVVYNFTSKNKKVVDFVFIIYIILTDLYFGVLVYDTNYQEKSFSDYLRTLYFFMLSSTLFILYRYQTTTIEVIIFIVYKFVVFLIFILINNHTTYILSFVYEFGFFLFWAIAVFLYMQFRQDFRTKALEFYAEQKYQNQYFESLITMINKSFLSLNISVYSLVFNNPFEKFLKALGLSDAVIEYNLKNTKNSKYANLFLNLNNNNFNNIPNNNNKADNNPTGGLNNNSYSNSRNLKFVNLNNLNLNNNNNSNNMNMMNNINNMSNINLMMNENSNVNPENVDLLNNYGYNTLNTAQAPQKLLMTSQNNFDNLNANAGFSNMNLMTPNTNNISNNNSNNATALVLVNSNNFQNFQNNSLSASSSNNNRRDILNNNAFSSQINNFNNFSNLNFNNNNNNNNNPYQNANSGFSNNRGFGILNFPNGVNINNNNVNNETNSINGNNNNNNFNINPNFTFLNQATNNMRNMNVNNMNPTERINLINNSSIPMMNNGNNINSSQNLFVNNQSNFYDFNKFNNLNSNNIYNMGNFNNNVNNNQNLSYNIFTTKMPNQTRDQNLAARMKLEEDIFIKKLDFLLKEVFVFFFEENSIRANNINERLQNNSSNANNQQTQNTNLKSMSEAIRNIFYSRFNLTINDGFVLNGIYSTLPNTPVQMTIELYYRKILTYQGELIEFYFNDITSTRAVETEKALNKVRSLVLAKISHEFKTPLITIIYILKNYLKSRKFTNSNEDGNNNTNTLSLVRPRNQNNYSTPNNNRNSSSGFNTNFSADDYIRNTIDLSDYMLSLINDIFDYSIINSEFDFKVDFEDFDFREMMEFSFRILKILLGCKGLLGSIKPLLEVDERIPKVFCNDEKRIKQILLNLITNSIKYTRKGYIRISAVLLDDNSNSVKISVEDTGYGIQPEIVQRIFNEIYIPTDNPESTQKSTSGLGLAICKKIIDKIGTKIECSSVVNKNTIFTFIIPSKEELDENISYLEYNLNNNVNNNNNYINTMGNTNINSKTEFMNKSGFTSSYTPMGNNNNSSAINNNGKPGPNFNLNLNFKNSNNIGNSNIRNNSLSVNNNNPNSKFRNFNLSSGARSYNFSERNNISTANRIKSAFNLNNNLSSNQKRYNSTNKSSSNNLFNQENNKNRINNNRNSNYDDMDGIYGKNSKKAFETKKNRNLNVSGFFNGNRDDNENPSNDNFNNYNNDFNYRSYQYEEEPTILQSPKEIPTDLGEITENNLNNSYSRNNPRKISNNSRRGNSNINRNSFVANYSEIKVYVKPIVNYFKCNKNNIILYVDDSEISRKSVRKQMLSLLDSMQDTEVVACKDGIEAFYLLYVDQLYNNKIKLIVSDDAMDLINGEELYNLISKYSDSNKLKKIPFVLCKTNEKNENNTLKKINDFYFTIKKNPKKEEILKLLELTLFK